MLVLGTVEAAALSALAMRLLASGRRAATVMKRASQVATAALT